MKLIIFNFTLLTSLILSVGTLSGKPAFLDLSRGRSDLGSVTKFVSIPQADIVCLKGGITQGFKNGAKVSVFNNQTEKIATLIVIKSKKNTSIALITEKNVDKNIRIGDSVKVNLR